MLHRVKIYFDGALPLSKRNTRLSRLEKSRRQLENFCRVNRKGFRSVLNAKPLSTIEPHQILQSRETFKPHGVLPDNAFMVSAVLEDLKLRWNTSAIRKRFPSSLTMDLSSEFVCPWAKLCETVPGEADYFCGESMRRISGAAVLTSDSDLLIHDVGLENSVILFSSIEMEGNHDGNLSRLVIKARSLRPATICRRLGIPSLSYLAYELKVNPHGRLGDLIHRSKTLSGIAKQHSGYVQFMEEYRSHKALPHVTAANSTLLQKLDVRVAELAIQWFIEPSFREGAPRIYLPLLQEDHTRKCAWEGGRHFRTLAYSLINSACASRERSDIIIECVRRGCRFCLDDIVLYEDDYTELELRSLLDRLELVRTRSCEEFKYPVFWRIFAAAELCKDNEELRTSLLNRKHLQAMVGSPNDWVSWIEIHVLAQLQAVLYSLRILSQALDIAPLDRASKKDLHTVLSNLPSLQVMMRSLRELRTELLG